ncbi:hypothetical protein P7C71_g3848, partial [Lecanoromycetidae sp. Uapishka_2]
MLFSQPDNLGSPWTVVHGFYAGMGGFAFRLDRTNATQPVPQFVSDYGRLTLTARGVALLADCGLLPYIEKEDIWDKSKSDGLSKFIACVQAAWMFVQIAGRLAAGLQVTLLEVNTLGHVLCALIMYILWWHKPRMVQEPIILKGDWVDSLCAYMYMSSRMSGNAQGGVDNSKILPEMSSVALSSDDSCLSTSGSTEADRADPEIVSCQSPSGALPQEGIPAISRPLRGNEMSSTHWCSTESCFRPFKRPLDPASRFTGPVDTASSADAIVELDAGQQLRWNLAAAAVTAYSGIRQRFREIKYTGIDGKESICLVEEEPEELLVRYSSNWSTRGLLHGEHGLIMGIILWFASMAFGGIHAAAWHNYFPSEVEAWIWRCSATYITWSGLVWLTINLSAKIYKPIDDLWIGQRLSKAPWVKSWVIAMICAICGALYIFARLYLVIEALISIRELPLGAYQTPDWTEIFPHL